MTDRFFEKNLKKCISQKWLNRKPNGTIRKQVGLEDSVPCAKELSRSLRAILKQKLQYLSPFRRAFMNEKLIKMNYV
jgi:hypothetical protein